jgi:hypothetical protein
MTAKEFIYQTPGEGVLKWHISLAEMDLVARPKYRLLTD